MTKICVRTFGIALGALVGLGGLASADTIRVPQDMRLDDALQAAKDGDRILVRGEHYLSGNEALAADNVTIIGRRARINGELNISGDGVTVRGFRFTGDIDVAGDRGTVKRNRFVGGSAVLRGDDARLHRNRFSYTYTRPIIAADVRGDGTTVSRNRFDGTMCAVVAEGDDVTVEDNRVNDAEEAGVIVIGDDAVVDDNVVRDVVLMDGVTVIGDDATVTDNRVDGAPGGIRVQGDDPEVTDNRCDVGFDDPALDVGFLPNCPGITIVCEKPGGVVEDNVVEVTNGSGLHLEMDGAVIDGNDVRQNGPLGNTTIEVRGDGNTITGNVTRREDGEIVVFGPMIPDFWPGLMSDAHGVAVDGNDNVVGHNKVRDAEGAGIVTTGNRNRVCDNRVTNPAGHAVAVSGSRNTVERTVVRNAGGDGVIVLGSANELEDNVVRDADGCGILLLGPATVTDCTVTGCDMGGLVNEGDGSSVADSRFTRNAPFDVANTGTFTSFENNVANRITTDPRDLPDHELVTPFPLQVGLVPPFGTQPNAPPIDPNRGFPGFEDPIFGNPNGGGNGFPGTGTGFFR